MYEFTVPDGDWYYDTQTKRYMGLPLVFTEKKKKGARAAIKEYVEEGIAFTMVFTPKGGCDG